MARKLFALLMCCFLSQNVAAKDDVNLEKELAILETALPGTLMNNPFDIDWSMYGEDYKVSLIKKLNIPGGYAYRIRIKKPKNEDWEISANAPVLAGVKKGDSILLAFWGRAHKFDKSTGLAAANVELHELSKPYTSIVGDEVFLSDQWQIHYLSRVSEKDFTADEIGVSFSIGSRKQTVEFGQFYVMNLGQNTDLSKYPYGSVNVDSK